MALNAPSAACQKDAPSAAREKDAAGATRRAQASTAHAPHYGDIDRLRGFAILMVVVFHLALLDRVTPPFMKFIARHFNLATGVDLFFVISGFVISTSLAPLWAAHGAAPALPLRPAVRRFYIKRILRLWPASAFWLFAILAFDMVFQGTPNWPPVPQVAIKLLAGLAYVYNIQELPHAEALGYLWSLSLEFQFYLALPLLLLWVPADRARLALILGAYAVLLAWAPGGQNWWLLRYDGIIFGILLYMIPPERRAAGAPRGAHSPASRGVLTATLLLTMMAATDLPFGRLDYLAVNLCGALAVNMAITPSGGISRLGLGRVLDWAGSRSYSLFLCHVPIMLTVTSLLWACGWGNPKTVSDRAWFNLGYFGLALPAIGAAAEATYRALERPSHRMSRRISLWRETVPPRPALQPGSLKG
jgi:peptidoglycan/LPS O-acetylase OafA/YrhL